ncbi:uncharacterized protein DS421_7g218840 [Arachis hypogaea]|nr:uncharacterized protein DS421_7g218840 [Arachis hypogaea]
MSGSGINVEENLNRLDEFHIFAHLHLKPVRVLPPHGTLVDVFSSDEADPSMEIRRQMLEPYLRRARFCYASLIKRFEYDNPLISAFVERWRLETHTFHLPWGECTVTLEDVAMHLGLPIDGEPVSGTLKSWSKFHQRDIRQWCEELLGEVPGRHVGTMKYNKKLKWLKSILQQMPLESPDDALVQYACCYVMYLLGGVLLPDKANNTVHASFLGTGRDESIHVSISYNAGKRGKNDYAEQRLQRHRLRLATLKVDEFLWMPYRDARILSRVPVEFLGAPHRDFYMAVVPLILFRWIEIVNINRVMQQFGGKQGPSNPSLNIDTFHRQSARNEDGW